MSKNPGSDYTASYRVAVDRNSDMYIDGGSRNRIGYPEQRRYILGRMFRGVKVKGDKLTRALTWIALAEEGRVHLVRGAWITEFIDETSSFPAGTHDDQINAVSLAFRMHQQHRNRLIRF